MEYKILQLSTSLRTIRHATTCDIPVMQAMYAHSKQVMRTNGNMTQWAGNYPDVAQIRQDMERGASFIIEEAGQAIGTFAFIIGEDPTYARIEAGSWPDNTPLYGTLHRIACAPGVHHIVSDCIRYGFRHISCLRIDTHADNHIMQHIVEKAGFQYCGIIYVADGTPRKAYQLTHNQLIPTLQEYVEKEIIPRYTHFDKAHREAHVRQVIQQSMELAVHYPVSINMVYAIAAYHDTGLTEGRDTHHLVSGRIIRTDAQLRKWFREEEIETMAEAAEDHRASAKHEPRSIYGKIVAEADRQIETEEVIRRTIQYALSTELNADTQRTGSQRTGSQWTGSQWAGSQKTGSQESDTQETDTQGANKQASATQRTDTQAANAQSSDAQATERQTTDTQTIKKQTADTQAIKEQATDVQATCGQTPVIQRTDAQRNDAETNDLETTNGQINDFKDDIKERCWQHTLTHLQEKYGRDGYLKLWIPESPNAEKLAELQNLIENKRALAEVFEKIYENERDK